MNSDHNDWDSVPGDPFHSVNREDWDEDDWDEFLYRQDALNAKYQELFETLRDHPERDEIIAREMHWNLPAELDDADLVSDDDLEDDFEDGLLDGFDDDEDEEELGEPFCCDACDDAECELDSIPAYTKAQDFALAVERQITARLRDAANSDEDAIVTTMAAFDVPARIGNGHGIGYERDSLCGNIACCKRALRSLDECLDGLLTLRQRGILVPREADRFLARGKGLAKAIADRIEALRGRVWWL